MPKQNIIKYIPYVVIVLSFIILLIRSFYSFCWSDETFYFATADRFLKGDRIFADDWFPTQLSGVFILPLYSLFVKITGSTAGVILFFRIVYTIIELAVGLLIYNLLKEIHGAAWSLCISLFIMFYTHLNIATVSYYTMSVLFFLMAMVLLYCFYKNNDSGSLYLISAGICFSISVLNLPTMALAYALIVVFGFILCIAAKLFKVDSPFLKSLKLPTVFIYTLIGISIPAVIFGIYLLTHVSIPDFIRAIPYVLSDDEHITSRLYPIRKMYLAIIESYGNKVFYLGCLVTAAAICLWALGLVCVRFKTYKMSDGNGKSGEILTLIERVLPVCEVIVFAVDMLAFVLYFYKSFGHTGYINTALMMFSLPLFFLSKKKDIFAFILFFLSGITFSLVFSYSSNGMLYVLAIGHFIASVGGMIFIKDFVDGLNTRVAAYIITVVIISSLIHTAAFRIANVYRDDKLSNLTETITQGPAKGLKTNIAHKQMYDEVYDVLTEHCQSDVISAGTSDSAAPGNLLISKLLPWGYMCTDMSIAAPTTWRSDMNSEKLKMYYELYPERFPDTILLLNNYYGTYETCGDVEFDPTPNENSSEGYIYSYISENSFEEIPVPCGTVYKKR